MGQYHYVVNLDKREFLHPHLFDDGLKLMEFGASGSGTMLGLALLLAASNGPEGRGGGDWHPWLGGPGYEGREVDVDPTRAALLAEHIPGRWAGDRIAIIGDYHAAGDVPGFTDREDTPWEDENSNRPWVDVSLIVREALRLDYYVSQDLQAEPRFAQPDQTVELQSDGRIVVVSA